jgi:hypothetical protein
MSPPTAEVPAQDAGITSATVNTSQQVADSIGTALLKRHHHERERRLHCSHP